MSGFFKNLEAWTKHQENHDAVNKAIAEERAWQKVVKLSREGGGASLWARGLDNRSPQREVKSKVHPEARRAFEEHFPKDE